MSSAEFQNCGKNGIKISDTPRVDSEEYSSTPSMEGEDDTIGFDYVPSEFARKLERELVAVEKNASDFYKALIALEWGDHDVDGSEQCPSCKAWRGDGEHDNGCELKLLLRNYIAFQERA